MSGIDRHTHELYSINTTDWQKADTTADPYIKANHMKNGIMALET